MDALLLAFKLIFEPQTLLVMFLASLFGLFMGAMPGLTAAMAVALLVPITFFMSPVPALAAIVCASAMAIFAGDIPGALMRLPGTPASAAYTDESYAMAKKGEAELVLGVDLTSSIIGGLFGAAVLIVAAPTMATFALKFSSWEFFWLSSLGLSCAVFISSGKPLRALISLFIGLLAAQIGADPTSGYARFTYGNIDLTGGVEFIPAMIGMFAVSEILRNVTSPTGKTAMIEAALGVKQIFRGLGSVLWRYRVPLARGSVTGTIVGILPGAGCDIAAWVSYGMSKKFSKEPEKFGTGHIEGIVEAGASNNSAIGGTWVPALVFGIPGDTITAIVIGVLFLKGINPGPLVFLQKPEIIYAVFISFILANLMMLPLGLAAIASAKHILRIPYEMLMPIILLFCMVGSFAMNNSVFGVAIMLAAGVLAYLMEENEFPVAPAILGLVLGPLVEENFMSTMIRTDGNLFAFFSPSRPIALVLGVITVLVWSLPLVQYLKRGTAGKASA